jgi:hypothetical protein
LVIQALKEKEMKSFLTLLISTVFLGIVLSVATFSLADNGCPLTGNTYSFEVEDVKYELSGFNCTFGPGCCSNCDLWYGDFDTGPLYHAVFPFQCYTDGSVTIAGLPCALTAGGNLECLIVDTSDYTCYEIGNQTWCVPEDGVVLDFTQE